MRTWVHKNDVETLPTKERLIMQAEFLTHAAYFDYSPDKLLSCPSTKSEAQHKLFLLTRHCPNETELATNIKTTFRL